MRYSISAGDALHLMGPLGAHLDYTVRLKLRLVDAVDGEILRRAAEKTQRRYPYFSVRLCRDENSYFYEDNPAPIVVQHGVARMRLNTAESNYHVWGVSYEGDVLCLEFSHGIADGNGMYRVLATLLYYYCAERYGVSDHTGIRTLEDPILPAETHDPIDDLPQIDLTGMKAQQRERAFSLTADGGMTSAEWTIIDFEVPESAFVRFSSAHDASPGTMVSILLARAIDAMYPERERPLIGGYVINGRPMLNGVESHHNCVTNVTFPFTERVKAMPFDRQCTVHRGATFVQSDAERVARTLGVFASISRGLMQAPIPLESKKQRFGQMISGAEQHFSFVVSYVGQWQQRALSPYILEFWTHVPCTLGLTAEIAAINGKIFVSLNQSFREDTVAKSFARQLEENGISYKMKKPIPTDIPYFPDL